MTEKTSQRGSNLTREDRERGGRASAAKQVRDARGQFAGRKNGGGAANRGRDQDQQMTDDRQLNQPPVESDQPESNP